MQVSSLEEPSWVKESLDQLTREQLVKELRYQEQCTHSKYKFYKEYVGYIKARLAQ